MRFTRRSMLGATALSASMLSLAACSQDDGSGSSGGGSDGGGEQIASTANDINEMPREDVGEGGVLRLYNNAFPANWNGFHLDGNEANTSEMNATLLPQLTLAGATGEVTANPQVAKRIELTSEDPQVMEIELVEGMSWSDGTPIDYKSIENVFTIMNGSDEEYVIASSSGYDQVEKIEQGENDLTAIITFKEKYADWMGLAAAGPDSLFESAEAFNTGWLAAPEVTGGPFKVSKIDAANKTVLVERDDNYWGDKAPLDQVLFTTIEDPAAAATSFQGGQLDVIEPTVPAQYSVVESMIGTGGVTIRKAAGPNWTHITLNGAEGRVLSDQKLRQAIHLAVDREEVFLSVNATMPYPENFPQLNNHLLVTNQDGYKDNAGKFATPDVEAAKALIEEAGYTYEGENATKDGEPLTITYVYNDGSKTNEAVVPVVQEALAAVGITMEVQKVPPTDLFSKYIGAGEYDLTLFGWVGTPFLSSGDAIWTSDGESNFSKTGSEECDKLIAAAAAETDIDTRLDLINQADALLWEIAGTMPLWQSYEFFVQHEDIANYGAWGFASPDWTKIGYVAGSPKLEG